MQTSRAFSLIIFSIFSALSCSSQTVISPAPVSVSVVAGQTACKASSFPIDFAPCDNTASSPLMAVGVFLTAGTPGRGGSPATIAINGVVAFPVPFGNNCKVGDLVGDIDGSGNLADLGPASTASGSAPASYVGICEGDNAQLTEMTIVVQPGYIFPANPDQSNVTKEKHK